MIAIRHLARLAVLVLLALAACTGLDPDVLYQCEEDHSCQQAGFVCLADGYCHPDAGSDAGMDSGVADSGADAGRDAGSDAGLDAGFDAGSDAGADAGMDGGAPDGGDGGAPDGGDGGIDAGCVPLACPVNAQCGFVDAGCGVELDCGRCLAPLECGTQTPLVCGLPHLCTQDRWCFENPLPQGFTLRGGWGLDERHVFWVGDNQLVLSYDGMRHTVMTMPPQLDGGVDFFAVDGTAANDVYAAGNRGVVAHLTDAGWKVEQGPGPVLEFRAVLALGDGGAIAAGNVIFRRDSAGGWHSASLPTTSVTFYTAVAQADGGVFAIGDPGGTLIQQAAPGSDVWKLIDDGGMFDSARSMWGEPNGSLVVAGVRNDAGLLLRRSFNGSWTPLLTQTVPLNVVRGAGGKLYAGGADGTLFDVGGMAAYSTGEGTWNALVPLANSVLVEGDDGRFAHFDPALSDFKLHSAGSYIGINAICGDDSSVPFAASAGPGCVGTSCQARILDRRLDAGLYWSIDDVTMPDTGQFNACTTTNGIEYLLGDGSHYLYRLGNGASLELVLDASGVAGPLTGVWADGLNRYFVNQVDGSMGPYVTLVTGPATGATYQLLNYTGGGDHLTAVGGAFPTGLLVGQKGLAIGIAPDGGLTGEFRLGTDDLLAVSAATLDDGGTVTVTVGRSGAVFRDEGAMSFAAEPVGAADLACVTATPGDDLWAAGARLAFGNTVAAIYRRAPGQSWAAQPLNLNQPVRAIWAAPADAGSTVWIGAGNGLILRQDN